MRYRNYNLQFVKLLLSLYSLLLPTISSTASIKITKSLQSSKIRGDANNFLVGQKSQNETVDESENDDDDLRQITLPIKEVDTDIIPISAKLISNNKNNDDNQDQNTISIKIQEPNEKSKILEIENEYNDPECIYWIHDICEYERVRSTNTIFSTNICCLYLFHTARTQFQDNLRLAASQRNVLSSKNLAKVLDEKMEGGGEEEEEGNETDSNSTNSVNIDQKTDLQNATSPKKSSPNSLLSQYSYNQKLGTKKSNKCRSKERFDLEYQLWEIYFKSKDEDARLQFEDFREKMTMRNDTKKRYTEWFGV